MRLAHSFALLLALTAAGCGTSGSGSNSPPPECTDPGTPGCEVVSAKQRIGSPAVPDADLQALAVGNTAFALDLYQQIREPKGNLFYSPFSISEALAMVYAGAHGDTEAQMASALHFTLPQAQLHPAFDSIDLALASRGQGAKGQDGAPFQLSVANALWGQIGFPFASPFLDTLAESYGAGMHVVDFIKSPEPSRQIINTWVSNHTAGKIPQLFDQGTITPDNRLVLTNAVYFNAAWMYPFEPGKTQTAAFTRSDGTQVQVPTMAQTQELQYGSGSDYAAVALPYGDAQLSMVIVLPKQGGLDAFEGSLTADNLGAILDGMTTYEVDLTLPKLKIQSSFSLADQLAKLGMTDAFTEKADFSGIDGRTDLFISAVVHKAWVDVDEAGTEAAAATGVGVGTTAIANQATMHVDHSFLFFIRDAGTRTIVFAGRVDDPSQ
jgi:serpin B